MERVSRSELEAHADVWDAAVARDAAVDPFCTGSAWQLSFHDAFEPERVLFFERAGDDVVVLAQKEGGALGPLLEPLEDMWGFGSPLVGPGAGALLASALLRRPCAVLLLGLPMDRARLAPLAEALSGRFAARALRPTTRRVASLVDGVDGWLSRRSAQFRRNLRAAARRVAEAEIRWRYVRAPEPDALAPLYDEILEVERRTWKSAAGNAADRPPMRTFYASLWPRLAGRGELRVLVAERAGRAVGYCHGAARADHFRGLQVSFDDACRDLGLGNVLQLEMIRRLVDEGVGHYDLGAQSAYKDRWAEPGLTTFGLLLQPLEPTRADR